MKEGARYIKIVEWSEEDQCFVGSCPGMIGPCCHGENEAVVYVELCQIVDEWIEILRREGKPLPTKTMGQDVAAAISGWTNVSELVGAKAPGDSLK